MDDELKVTFKWLDWMNDGSRKVWNDFESKLASFAYTRPKWTNLSFFAYRSLNNITVLTVLDIKKLLSQIYLERDS